MKRVLLISFIILAIVFVAAACGKKEAAPDAAPTAPPSGPAVPAASANAAETLGQKIGSSYIETLKQVVAMLNDRPAAADAKSMLSDMKNWTIELMVNLGKEREALGVADRVRVDQVLSNRIAAVPADLFKDYQAGQMHYRDDRELFQLIADFNIITQYANYDLLKKQLPAEAQRLGIQ
jgi:predicted small lipoprotein YifL